MVGQSPVPQACTGCFACAAAHRFWIQVAKVSSGALQDFDKEVTDFDVQICLDRSHETLLSKSCIFKLTRAQY
jgi:hypothetical protein